MELIFDIEEKKKLIEGSIKKYGHAAENNYWNLKYLGGKETRSAFFEDNGMGVMCVNYGRTWEVLPGILASQEKRFWILQEFMDHLLDKKHARKIFVVGPEEYMQRVRGIKKYKIPGRYRTFYLPVYNLKEWDTTMPGKKWKKLRNLRNKLYSNHKVEFVPCKDICKQELKKILYSWRKRRYPTERVWYPQFYDNILENDFEGIENTMSLIVDGIPCTISGGWKIPNSDKYYSAVGLLNYNFEGIGEASIMEEFNLLKEMGYSSVNFGQSENSLLNFKKKFYPGEIEVEIRFSVSKNK